MRVEIERQREATNRLVNAIESEISGLGSQLERSAAEMMLHQDNLAERRAVLRRRLADIYKRGPLYTFQVLLAAESFGDLLTRYKYLYLSSRQDRDLVTEMRNEWKVVSSREPSAQEWADLELAWTIAWRVKSNTIVLVREGATVGIGAGMLRIPRPVATASANSRSTFINPDTIRSRIAGVCTRESSKRNALMMCARSGGV